MILLSLSAYLKLLGFRLPHCALFLILRYFEFGYTANGSSRFLLLLLLPNLRPPYRLLPFTKALMEP